MDLDKELSSDIWLCKGEKAEFVLSEQMSWKRFKVFCVCVYFFLFSSLLVEKWNEYFYQNYQI